jgi:hypothetical protein
MNCSSVHWSLLSTYCLDIEIAGNELVRMPIIGQGVLIGDQSVRCRQGHVVLTMKHSRRAQQVEDFGAAVQSTLLTPYS